MIRTTEQPKRDTGARLRGLRTRAPNLLAGNNTCLSAYSPTGEISYSRPVATPLACAPSAQRGPLFSFAGVPSQPRKSLPRARMINCSSCERGAGEFQDVRGAVTRRATCAPVATSHTPQATGAATQGAMP